MRNNLRVQVWISLLAFLALSTSVQAKETPPKNRVSAEKARAVALKIVSGTIKGEELEFEGGRWIYSFDIQKTGSPSVNEVHVDALSGKLLDRHTETAADEKREAQDDAN